jgi:tRNA(fMet)-specific endonuclease VapC
MPGSYLLDTNIVIPFLDGERSVVDRVLRLDGIHISAITFGELIYGACHSRLEADNLKKIDRLYDLVHLLEVDRTTSEIYGKIKGDLRKTGRPIPDNDIWVAASARQHELTLATRDGHFKNVSNLDCENW